ncbi:MAG: hypothetical protein HOJ34_01015 [Kordiimonadaceae bacterium]|jgi:hypothetical protein|nr:hypothetical protein [Kordiimonadaceae bacterium]MBT6036826.1 hypothetical protein [Kordiimonadaceae bacterium]MBT6328337.1 hypothetical protein [Kordiimonadaceae bacterium]MBT7581467.1 hypothetical protein [Kordiimonadaceae bacterium]
MENVKKNWPEFLTALVCAGLLWKVFEQSVLEHHFIIPTTFFAPAVILGNVVYYSRKGHKWAKLALFWAFVIGDFCSFLAIFYSPSLAKISSGPIIVAVLVLIFTYLLYGYQKSNELFKD